MAGGSNPPSATTPLAQLASRVVSGADALAIPSDAQLVLAVSGGADSMALLHGAAAAVASGMRGWRLSVAHLDHAIRPTSADDAAFVADAARALGLTCAVARADVPALADREGRSLEEAGREARYRFLAEVAGESALVATAHTLDDSVETVLLNVLRGTGITGLAGIPARRGNVVRPLLAERRAGLRALLDAAGVPHREDPTNADPVHLRNRIRHDLVPMLESLAPGAVERLARLAGLASADDRLLDEVADADVAARLRSDGTLDWTRPPSRGLGRRVLRRWIGDPAPSAERIDALLDAAEGPRGGLRIELGARRTASVTERAITLDRPE